MSDIYCGAKDVPSKKRRGSMKECVDKKQISYYGVKKVDSRLLEAMLKPKEKKDKISLEKISTQRALIAVKISKLKKQIAAETSSKKKKELEKTKAELDKKLAEVIKVFNEVNKKFKGLSRVSRHSKNSRSQRRSISKKSKRSASRKSAHKRIHK